MTHSGDEVVLQIRPEPTPEEREALLRALAAAGLLENGLDPDAWWLDGVRESLDAETPARPAAEGRTLSG
jgi:hypothetical protein